MLALHQAATSLACANLRSRSTTISCHGANLMATCLLRSNSRWLRVLASLIASFRSVCTRARLSEIRPLRISSRFRVRPLQTRPRSLSLKAPAR